MINLDILLKENVNFGLIFSFNKWILYSEDET